MNIALFTDTYLPHKNGVAVSVNQLKYELAKLGHNVYIYTIHIPDAGGEIEDHVTRSRALPVAGLGSDENLLAVPSLVRTLRDLRSNNVEIIHTHTELPQGFLGRHCARVLNVPHIHTVHTMWSDYRHYLFRGRLLTERNVAFAYHLFLRKTTAIVTPSLKAKQFLSSIKIKGVRINNGIDQELFFADLDTAKQEAIRTQHGIMPNAKVILFVGRIAPEKRVRELYTAIARVMQGDNSVKMLYIGAGVDMIHLRQRAAQDDLEDRMIFVGNVPHDEMVNYYALAHLYVTLSISEVQPVSLIEALFAGLPIIGRRDVAFDGLIASGVNGGQYDSDDEVAGAIVDFFADLALADRYSEASLGLAQNFTSRKNAEQMIALYHEAIRLGRPEAFQKGPLFYDT
jgi:1,2-diacylglycerol 3-alpha-glucosyltransferase